MLRHLWRGAFKKPTIDPEVVAWYGIQAIAGKKPIGWVDPQPYLDHQQLFARGLISLEGQRLEDLQQYTELVAFMESHGVSQLPDRRVWI